MAEQNLSGELPDALIDAHLGLAYQSSGLNAMGGESWDRVVARRFFALGMATAAGLIEMPARAAACPVTEEWNEASRIRDLPEVDEAIRNMLEDQTGDNSTCMVREVLRAARGVDLPDGAKNG